MSILIVFFKCRLLNEYCVYFEFYYRIILSGACNCVRPIEVHLDQRAEDDVMKTLPPIVKCKVGRPRKQRTPSLSEVKTSSNHTHCNHKGHNGRPYKLDPIN